MSASPGAWLEARDILAVRMDNLGDVVMLGPALRAVKSASPQARITLLASPAGATAAPLLECVDTVIAWRAVWQDLGHLPFDPARELELVALLRERDFDAALIFTSFSQTPHTPAYVCYLAGVPLRAGESKEFGGVALTDWLRAAPDDLHQAERNLRLVESLGFVARERGLRVAIPDAARARAAALLRDVGVDPAAPYLLLHPGTSASARRYPPERFGAVARLLRAAGARVVVTGTERERPLLAEMLRAAPGTPALIGGTSVTEYAALVERASLVICNNSLPLHLADATRTPLVVIYSGADYEAQWRPRDTRATLLRRDTPCHPCYRFDCPVGLACLDIAPDEVADAAFALLGAAMSLAGARA